MIIAEAQRESHADPTRPDEDLHELLLSFEARQRFDVVLKSGHALSNVTLCHDGGTPGIVMFEELNRPLLQDSQLYVVLDEIAAFRVLFKVHKVPHV
jgi:hypothetical protein